MMHSGFRLACAAVMAMTVWGQAEKPYLSSDRRAMTAPELKDAPDEWISRSFQWVEEMLTEHKPAVVEHPVRRAALIRLDDVLHIESAPKKTLVQEFYRARMEKAVAEIEQTRVSSGMRIWKLYNHGWLVRTRTVSFAFDIVPGTSEPGFTVDKGVLRRLAAQADALFISHMHSDHANQMVAGLFLEMNKPVVAPEGLWQGSEMAAKLTYPERSAWKVHVLALSGGRSLKYVAYPGHQGKAPINNVHLVRAPEGLTVVQTGDQYGDAGPGTDFDWIMRIGRKHKVDVLLPNCWTKEIQKMAQGVNPALILTGHENEMGHTVDHREDYTQTYNRLFGSRYPFIVMGWGESYGFSR